MTKLKQLRLEKNLTKKELAQELKISASLYSRWENEKENISTRNIYKLAKYYQVNIDYLLGLEKKRKKIIINETINTSLVSNRMIEIRNDYKETLREFVKKLNTSNSTWSAYEKNKVLILSTFLIKICQIGNYSADWILGISDIKYRN